MMRYGVKSQTGEAKKMYKILYMEKLRENLQEISDFLDDIDVNLADKILDEISMRIQSLENMPSRFPRYAYNKDYRWTKVRKYMIFYKVFDDTKIVEVHRILHSAQNIKDLL